MNEIDSNNEKSKYRIKAEELLENKNEIEYSDLSILETHRLIHELDVHQIELEMQNEELKKVKALQASAVEKYTDLYDFAPTGYLTLAKDSTIKELNFCASKLIGKDRHNLTNTQFIQYIEDNSKINFNAFLDNIFKNKINSNCEIYLTNIDDNITYVLLEGTYVESSNQCLVSMSNITAIILTKNELIKAKERAEESDRLKSSFLANISHEIRTPMNRILGFASLLKEPSLSGEDKYDYIEMIEKSGKRMLNLIDDIIHISKVDSGQEKVNISNTNINDIIEDLYSFFKPEVNSKNLEFGYANELEFSEANILTDNEKVYEILMNLIKNAIKFTDYGAIRFGYLTKGDKIEFFVKDTGIGIPENQKNFIYDRFRQGSESLSRLYEGAGLGLSISKAYIEMLDGEIWFESVVGKGTTFYFSLPYNTISRIQTVKESYFKKINDNFVNSKINILLAEDDITSQMLLERLLKNNTKQLIIVNNGIDAVETCKKNPDIDLILMDIKMPRIDGYEATARIREFNKNIIIIAQTAYAFENDKQKALDAGCNEYISKPIDFHLLKQLINKYFNIYNN